MKLKYEKKKGERVKRYFMGFMTFDTAPGGGFWHYNTTLKRWEENINFKHHGYSTHAPCLSVRAFRRMLKKAPKGVKFHLIGKWFYHNIVGVGSKLMDGNK